MKHQFSFRPIKAIFVILIFASCSSDEGFYYMPPPPPPPDSTYKIPLPNELNLTVNAWTYSNDQQQFVSPFTDLFENRDLAGKTVSVYADIPVKDGSNTLVYVYSVLINNGRFKTYGGELWAEVANADLNIYFKPGVERYMPFEALKITVKIE